MLADFQICICVHLILSRKSLLRICKSFVRSNLDYADIIYDKPFNQSFKRKIKMVQYKAALVITTGVIKGVSRDRLYQELGLESLAERKWFRRLFYFHISYLQTYNNAVSEGVHLTRIKLSQFQQEPKYLRVYFFHIALRNRVNSTTKQEIYNQSINLK